MATLRTIARPYAEAIFEISVASNEHALWRGALSTLKQIWSQPQLTVLLENPRLSHSFLLNCFTQFDQLSSQPVTRFINLLIQQQRLEIIPELYPLYLHAMRAHENKLDVNVASAHPLTKSQLKGLKSRLTQTLHKDIFFTEQIDPNLMGGFTLQYHDQIIDYSISGRLKQLYKQLTEVTYAA